MDFLDARPDISHRMFYCELPGVQYMAVTEDHHVMFYVKCPKPDVMEHWFRVVAELNAHVEDGNKHLYLTKTDNNPFDMYVPGFNSDRPIVVEE